MDEMRMGRVIKIVGREAGGGKISEDGVNVFRDQQGGRFIAQPDQRGDVLRYRVTAQLTLKKRNKPLIDRIQLGAIALAGWSSRLTKVSGGIVPAGFAKTPLKFLLINSSGPS